jgi:hypothetical protein
MIYQTPDPWRLERRGPQHAAPFDTSAPLRRHGGRALRLIVTAGAWGAGLCLVIGLVAMVAQAAVPHHPARSAPIDAASGSGASSAAYVRYIKRSSGTGLGAMSFSMAARSRWELTWSYHCYAAGSRGHLVISEPGNRAGARVSAAGQVGHGTVWTYSDQRDHLLVIATDCTWNVLVAGHR